LARELAFSTQYSGGENPVIHAVPQHRHRDDPARAPIWRPVIEHGGVAARRGALATTNEPPGILRHGVPIPVSPTEAALLGLLVRKGRAAYVDMAAALRELGFGTDSIDVHVYRIRRKFAAAGAPDPVETVRGWGLRLRVEPDARGSTSLWICGERWPAIP
jgi:DNA-binding response OmpR family regulator